jgi:hypothetical protein
MMSTVTFVLLAPFVMGAAQAPAGRWRSGAMRC